ncbi:MAG TPA: hypothetical protein VGI99_11290, partial [Gemmataceae bacterium]
MNRESTDVTSDLLAPHPLPLTPSAASDLTPHPSPLTPPGSSKELLKLALPLVISQSFMTVQVLADTLLLAKHNTDEMTASFPAVMWYWL